MNQQTQKRVVDFDCGGSPRNSHSELQENGSGPQNFSRSTDFKTLFEDNPLGIATTDAQFGFIHVNQAFVNMIGYSAEELLNGMHLAQLSPNEAAAAKSKTLVKKLFNREIKSFEIEKVYKRKDGKLVEALVSVTATYSEVGELTGCTAFILDITKRRRMEQELKKLLAQMKATQEELVRSEKLASLGALVAGIAHEINTPVGSSLTIATSLHSRVKALGKAFDDQGQDLQQTEQMIQKLQSGVQLLVKNLTRAGQLISNFKKVAVDRTTGIRRKFLLHELVSEVVSTQKHISKNRINFILNIPTHFEMNSFPGGLGRVFSNLIDNASLHAYPNLSSGPLYIEAKDIDSEPDKVMVLVHDKGIGMTAEIMDHIFDPFFTTKMGMGGSGLGLHIVYGIVVNLLQGSCRFESTQGEGTTFQMILPLEVTKD